MKAKLTKRKKPMTLVGFAAAIQADIAALRADMAEGFRGVRPDMATKAELREIRDRLTAVERKLGIGRGAA